MKYPSRASMLVVTGSDQNKFLISLKGVLEIEDPVAFTDEADQPY
jgi:hypothetical protein